MAKDQENLAQTPTQNGNNIDINANSQTKKGILKDDLEVGKGEKVSNIDTLSEAPKGFFAKIKEKISNIVEAVKESAPVKFISEKIDQFKETKIGGAISKGIETIGKVVTSKPFIFVATTAASIALAVATGPVGIAAAAVGAGIELGLNVKKTREARELDTQHKTLTDNRSNMSYDKEIFKLNPELQKTLEKELIQIKPDIKDKDLNTHGKAGLIKEAVLDVTKDIIKEKVLEIGASVGTEMLKKSAESVSTEVATEAAKEGVKSIGDIFKDSAKEALLNPTPVGVAKLVIKTAFGLKEAYEDAKKFNELKNEINIEKNKPDTPGYSSTYELAKLSREQEIQTKALKTCIADKSFGSLTPEKQVDFFKAQKQEIAKSIPEPKEPKKGLAAFLEGVKEVFKDLGKTLNPFDRHNTPNTIELTQKTGLAKGQEKQENLAQERVTAQQKEQKQTKEAPELNSNKSSLSQTEKENIKNTLLAFKTNHNTVESTSIAPSQVAIANNKKTQEKSSNIGGRE